MILLYKCGNTILGPICEREDTLNWIRVLLSHVPVLAAHPWPGYYLSPFWTQKNYFFSGVASYGLPPAWMFCFGGGIFGEASVVEVIFRNVACTFSSHWPLHSSSVLRPVGKSLCSINCHFFSILSLWFVSRFHERKFEVRYPVLLKGISSTGDTFTVAGYPSNLVYM